jgi:hypothetical protein
VHRLALGLWLLMGKQIIETIQQNFESGNKEFEQRIWKFLFLELDKSDIIHTEYRTKYCSP